MTYCDFKVGDEIVCVDANEIPPSGQGHFRCPLSGLLVEGAVYTVSGLVDWLGEIGVQLAEVSSDHVTGSFLSSRFRKVERKTDKLSLTEWLAQPTDYDEEQRNPAPAAPAKRERV